MTPDEFFSDQPLAEQLYAAVRGAVGSIGPVEEEVRSWLRAAWDAA